MYIKISKKSKKKDGLNQYFFCFLSILLFGSQNQRKKEEKAWEQDIQNTGVQQSGAKERGEKYKYACCKNVCFK